MFTTQATRHDLMPDEVPSPTVDAPIDMAHLARYTMNDRELEYEILHLFIGTLTQTADTLKQQPRNSQDWAMAAHTLKGSSRAVGAWTLAHLMKNFEDTRNQPVSDQLHRDNLTELDNAVRDVIQFIKKPTSQRLTFVKAGIWTQAQARLQRQNHQLALKTAPVTSRTPPTLSFP